jgi:hypothetical protein
MAVADAEYQVTSIPRLKIRWLSVVTAVYSQLACEPGQATPAQVDHMSY